MLNEWLDGWIEGGKKKKRGNDNGSKERGRDGREEGGRINGWMNREGLLIKPYEIIRRKMMF